MEGRTRVVPATLDSRRYGSFIRRTTCRFCLEPQLTKLLDFGSVPLAGGFLREDQLSDEKVYPLEVQFCENCTLVQVSNVVSPEVLFRHYFYFSSAIQTLVRHFSDLAKEIVEQLPHPSEALVVEIGCNDGVFLKPLSALGVRCVGVDPATNVVQSSGLPASMIVNDCFTERVAGRIRSEHGRADMIVASYSFAHIDDMVDVMKGIQTILKPGGVFVFEVYYLGTMVDEMQYDMIYHEHMSYYTLTALQRFFGKFGMEIYDVRRMPLRAGTMRFYARWNMKSQPASRAVEELLAYERSRKLDRLETYLDFAKSVEGTKADLVSLLARLKGAGHTIVGYGASGRASTIMNYCGIDGRYLDYVVDDAPAKHGFYTPGTHLPIRPWSATDGKPPDYVLVFAWSFIDEVKKRRADYLVHGGKFIVPLPQVRIVTA
jgi:methylation protein EvaC